MAATPFVTSVEPFVASAFSGQGWIQVGELGLALLLSGLIGIEREIRQKSAGLRTHTLVGVGAALFMLISKYGFSDVLKPNLVVVDPSRVAAQIVTGIGFLGAGLIFVRRDSVRGLTTAASIWVTAAIGAAAAAALPILAIVTTAMYFLVALVFPLASRRLPRSSTAISVLSVRYPDGRGILRQLLAIASKHGFAIDDVATEPLRGAHGESEERIVQVTMHLHGRGIVSELAAAMSELDGVSAVEADEANASGD